MKYGTVDQKRESYIKTKKKQKNKKEENSEKYQYRRKIGKRRWKKKKKKEENKNNTYAYVRPRSLPVRDNPGDTDVSPV